MVDCLLICQNNKPRKKLQDDIYINNNICPKATTEMEIPA